MKQKPSLLAKIDTGRSAEMAQSQFVIIRQSCPRIAIPVSRTTPVHFQIGTLSRCSQIQLLVVNLTTGTQLP